MTGEQHPPELPGRLLTDWPATAWRDVHVVAAVSAGADSMALLRVLIAAKLETGGSGRVLAAHVNHGLRGPESDEDESWLREQCQRLGVPLSVRRADPAALAERQGDGLEAAARELRYQLLADMAEEAGARYVAVAHTRDDQVETVLFRLFRGTGLRGLAGMRRTRPLSTSVTLVRPLLACDRAELHRFLEGLGQQWREDPTNQDVSLARRNRIRRELLPYVRAHFNADVDAAVVRAADHVADAQQLVETLAEELLDQCQVDASTDGVSLHLEALANRPRLLVVEALRQAWRAAGWPEQAMTRHWWRQLAAFSCDADGGDRLNLPGNVLASREGDRLVLRRQ
jgi:tRNA(Ile)-lysidine synthase